MSLNVSVGLSKKMGLPNYGSLGSSCQVEFEADSMLLENDPQEFQERIRRAYAACAQAVREELARQMAPADGNGKGKGPAATASSPAPPAGNGTHGGGHGFSRASQRQMQYLAQLAGKIPGLSVRWLESLCQQRFEKPLDDLSGPQASELIDTLMALRTGQIEAGEVLKQSDS